MNANADNLELTNSRTDACPSKAQRATQLLYTPVFGIQSGPQPNFVVNFVVNFVDKVDDKVDDENPPEARNRNLCVLGYGFALLPSR